MSTCCGGACRRSNPIRVLLSGLTGRAYAVTRYRVREGALEAQEKHDVTADVKALMELAWDEGYTSGHSNAMRRMSDEPDAPTTPNPYRAALAEEGDDVDLLVCGDCNGLGCRSCGGTGLNR